MPITTIHPFIHLRKHLVDKKQSLDQIIRAKAQLVKNRLSYGRPFDRNRILADIVYGSWKDAAEAFAESHYSPQKCMMETVVLALIRSGVSKENVRVENGHFIIKLPNLSYVLSKNDGCMGYKAKPGDSGRLYSEGPIMAMLPAGFAEFIHLFDESMALMKDLTDDIEREIRELRIKQQQELMVQRIEAQTALALQTMKNL